MRRKHVASALLASAFLVAGFLNGIFAAPATPAEQAAPPAAVPASASSPDVPAYKAAERLKARLFYDPLTGYGILERAGLRASFAAGVPWIALAWSKAIPVDPPRAGEVGLSFAPATVATLEKAFADAEATFRSHFSVAAILVDPGHGGKDPGAVGEHVIGGKRVRVVEKDLALEVSLMLYKSLKERFPDRRILITREGDSYPSLEERVAMANSVELAENEAIIYVSVHANASFNKNARGFEVWYLNPEYRRKLVDGTKPGGPGGDIAPILNAMLEEEFTTESIILARDISDRLQADIGTESPNRGVRAEEWFVVRNARMPSVLVETGFVTNPDEARLLGSDDYLRQVADGIYNGVVDFVSYFESMKGAPSP